MSFNGINSVVRVAGSASLNLTSAMTLSAWIRPTASQSGWRTIMQRQADAYFLNASNDAAAAARRAAAPSAATSSTSAARRPTRSTPGPMSALTYDGTTLRLYVNGTQVATRAATGAIQTTTNPLWIGGNSPYGEYFQGLIDEVRVYNRALTPPTSKPT